MELTPRTHYFDPSCSYESVLLPDDTFIDKQNKNDAYALRLQYEYQQTECDGGYTLFYTLTYNDNHLPRFHGIPVFDHRDLTYLVGKSKGTSNFIQTLNLRNTQCKYFITCEYGDSHGRPHYHALFFLTPIDSNLPIIRPIDFYDIIIGIWQGCYDWSNANFGSCVPGDNLGVLNSFNAALYVSKYCAKSFESAACDEYVKQAIISDFPHDGDFNEYVDFELHTYKIRHKQKVRLSHGVGSSFLTTYNPLVDDRCKMIKGNRVHTMPLPLYYYRKVFCDVVKDVNGNNRYVHNELYKQYKLNKLEDKITKTQRDIESVLEHNSH